MGACDEKGEGGKAMAMGVTISTHGYLQLVTEHLVISRNLRF